jgi:hypothetical protein
MDLKAMDLKAMDLKVDGVVEHHMDGITGKQKDGITRNEDRSRRLPLATLSWPLCGVYDVSGFARAPWWFSGPR